MTPKAADRAKDAPGRHNAKPQVRALLALDAPVAPPGGAAAGAPITHRASAKRVSNTRHRALANRLPRLYPWSRKIQYVLFHSAASKKSAAT